MTHLDMVHDPLHISPAGLDLIKAWEGQEDGDPSTVKLDPYLDAAGLWTVGWGHLVKDGEDFTGGITQEQAEALLLQDVRWAEKVVNGNVHVKLNQHQFDSLVSFVFNCGAGAFLQSTLLEKLNEGQILEVPEQLCRWIRAGGRRLLGLARRRVAEAQMFLQ